MPAGGARQHFPVEGAVGNLGSPSYQVKNSRNYGSTLQRGPKNCGSGSDPSDGLGPRPQRNQALDLGAERQQTPRPSHSQDARTDVSSLPQGQRPRIYVSAAEQKHAAKDFGLLPKSSNGPHIHGNGDSRHPAPEDLHLQEMRRNSYLGASLGLNSARAQEVSRVTGHGHLSQHHVRQSKDVSVPETGRKNPDTSKSFVHYFSGLEMVQHCSILSFPSPSSLGTFSSSHSVNRLCSLTRIRSTQVLCV